MPNDAEGGDFVSPAESGYNMPPTSASPLSSVGLIMGSRRDDELATSFSWAGSRSLVRLVGPARTRQLACFADRRPQRPVRHVVFLRRGDRRNGGQDTGDHGGCDSSPDSADAFRR